jgi:predicted ATPase
MKIHFQNIGPVKKAEVDLSKKLTVFTGPNNTGKTYIAYAIYGVCTRILENSLHFLLSASQIEKLITEKKIEYKPDSAKIKTFENKIFETNKILSQTYGIPEKNISDIFEFSDIASQTDVPENYLLHKKSKLTGFDFEIKIEKTKQNKFLTIHLITENSALSNSNLTAETLNFEISRMIFRLYTIYPIGSLYILPVERNSIYTFSKELSLKRNDIFEDIQAFKDADKISEIEELIKKTTRYPLPIRNGLKTANDLVNLKKQHGDFYEFATQIEKELLDGSISVSDDGEVLFTSNKAKTKKLPVHLSASLVKTLSNLIFYLKHLVEENDLIIIDEPEMNLHPDNQVLIARIFARLINKGIRLLVSTHSDYILRELNNLIMLSEIEKPSELIKEYGYKSDELLKKDDVGAYFFDYAGKSKVNVKSLPITEEGFEVETINREIDKLNQRSQELYYYLKQADDEE